MASVSQPSSSVHEVTATCAHDIREAFTSSIMMILGFITMGAGLGVLVTSFGLPWWIATVLSGVVYAGSVEFLLVGMIAAAAPLSLIASTTLLINARHLVYGISFPLSNVKGFFGKFLSIYMLSDEAYALNTGPGSKEFSSARILTISLSLWGSWMIGSTLGALVGATFLSDLKGVDFVMTGMFLILAIDSYKAVRDQKTATAAVFASVLALILAPDSFLLIALLTLLVLLTIRHFAEKKRSASTAATLRGATAQKEDDDA